MGLAEVVVEDGEEVEAAALEVEEEVEIEMTITEAVAMTDAMGEVAEGTGGAPTLNAAIQTSPGEISVISAKV